MTSDDGDGALRLHSAPTIGRVKRNLEAAKSRCAKDQRPYPPLLIDLDYIIGQLDRLFQENAYLRIGLEQAADRFADLVGEPEYGEVAREAAKKWLFEARSALGDLDEDGRKEDS